MAEAEALVCGDYTLNIAKKEEELDLHDLSR